MCYKSNTRRAYTGCIWKKLFSEYFDDFASMEIKKYSDASQTTQSIFHGHPVWSNRYTYSRMMRTEFRHFAYIIDKLWPNRWIALTMHVACIFWIFDDANNILHTPLILWVSTYGYPIFDICLSNLVPFHPDWSFYILFWFFFSRSLNFLHENRENMQVTCYFCLS